MVRDTKLQNQNAIRSKKDSVVTDEDFYKSAHNLKVNQKKEKRDGNCCKLIAECGPQTEALRTSILTSPKAMKRVDNEEK